MSTETDRRQPLNIRTDGAVEIGESVAAHRAYIQRCLAAEAAELDDKLQAAYADGRKDEREELAAINAELLAALTEAIGAVKTFHGPDRWDIYRDRSPEMKRWRTAIANATTGSAKP